MKPAAAIATSSTWSWKTTTPSVSRSGSRSDSCSTGGSNDGSSRSALPVLDVRMHGLALDRPGPDERHLHRQVVEVLRPRRSRLCICARLSIWKTPTVSAAWISA